MATVDVIRDTKIMKLIFKAKPFPVLFRQNPPSSLVPRREHNVYLKPVIISRKQTGWTIRGNPFLLKLHDISSIALSNLLY